MGHCTVRPQERSRWFESIQNDIGFLVKHSTFEWLVKVGINKVFNRLVYKVKSRCSGNGIFEKFLLSLYIEVSFGMTVKSPALQLLSFGSYKQVHFTTSTFERLTDAG